MRHWTCIIACILAAGAGTGQVAPVPGRSDGDGCYLGAYIQQDPVVEGDIGAFERLVGRKHAAYCRYVGYGQPFPFQWASKLKRIGAVPHIAWEPNEGLSAVRNDEYLRGWVEACRHYGAPILLRFASEMNGDWEAWSGDPDLYVEKWRMVYDAFHETAPNVIVIWCPFATPKSTIPLYYPGDGYVDWVGVNVYSVIFHSGRMDKPATDDAVRHLQFIYDLYSETHPIAVCEYAATHRCGVAETDTVEFAVEQMQRMYRSIRTRFPKVRLISWLSVDALCEGVAENDYAVTSNEEVLDAYRSLISSGHFLGRMPASEIAHVRGGSAVPAGGGQVAPRPDWEPENLVYAPWAQAARQQGGDGLTSAGGGASSTADTEVPLAETADAAVPPDGIVIIVRGGRPDALHGQVVVEALVGDNLQPHRVVLRLDGKFRAVSTTPAYFFRWNTDEAQAGEHRIEAIAKDAAGGPIARATAAVVVAGGRGS